MVRLQLLTLVSAILLLALPTGATADETADMADVTKFLNKTFPNDTWGRGPTRLSGAARSSAPRQVASRARGTHPTFTSGVTDMPGASMWFGSGGSSKTILMGTLCTTLT